MDGSSRSLTDVRATDAGQGVGLVGGAWAGPAALCCLPARLLVGACGTGPTALGLARLLPVVRGMACRAQQQRCGPMGGGEYEWERPTRFLKKKKKERSTRLCVRCGRVRAALLHWNWTGLHNHPGTKYQEPYRTEITEIEVFGSMFNFEFLGTKLPR